MHLLVYDTGNWRDQRPWGTCFLLLLFYFIGILIYREGTLPTIDTGAYLIRWQPIVQYALEPVFAPQWQIFTYHFLHFGIVHYAYTGGLLFYYVQGLERATSTKFVLLSYFVIASFAPFFIGIFALAARALIPATQQYFLVASYFLGSSVGIWGLIGLTVPISYRRKYFWFNIVLLLIPEFILKLVVGRTDILSNTSHIIVFLGCWFFSAFFIRFDNHDGHVGEMQLGRRDDRWLLFLVWSHALILAVYFLQIFEIMPQEM